MITVNLLPLSERAAAWSFQRSCLLGGVIVLSIYGSIFAAQYYAAWTLEKDIAVARQRYSLLLPVQDTMRAAMDKQQTIDKKNNTLAAITGERKSWHAVIRHFGIITPPQIWLTELAASDKNVILLKGNARTYPDLAAYLDSLEQDVLLAEPALIKAEQDSQFGYTRFEITVKRKEQ